MTIGVGDLAAVAFTVAEGDGTTAGTFAVTSPSGIVTAPTPAGAGTTWSFQVPLTEAGLWRGLFTTTGAGEGTEPWELDVLPNLPVSKRSYATTEDLANWLEDEPLPSSPARKLAIATRRIDRELMTSVYPVDDDGMPTDADHAIALRDATCAQVEYMVETGDESGQGVALAYSNVSIGSVTLGRASSGSGVGRSISGEALTILQLAGLLPGQPYTY